MTPTPTRTRTQVHHPRRRRRPRRRDVLHGLAAILAIVAVVAGVPLLLAVVAPLSPPTALPTWDQISTGLMRPDDGTVFLTVLALLAWAGWAVFTLSVVLEVLAQARGLPTPRIPLARTSQRLAAGLVTTAGLLLASTAPLTTAAAHAATTPPATTAPATTAPVAATPAVGPPTGPAGGHAPPGGVHASEDAAAPTREADPDRAADRYPVVVVDRGDSLWRLAERHLGDGERYGEIVALNHGRPQGDGHALTDSHWLNPGWELRLPTDATGAPTPHTATSSSADPPAPEPRAQVEVEPGDTLWGIAAEQLGDGTRYGEVYDLNAGRPQPDGRALTDPDLIYPGWRLTLPTLPAGDTTATDPPAGVAPPADAVAASDVPAPPVGDLENDPAPATGAVAAPSAAAPAPARDHADAGLGDVDDSAPAPAQQSLFAGLTALGAAAVIGALTRRRRRQQNRRRPGERITLPAAGTPAAGTERVLRRAGVDLTLEDLTRALQRFASRVEAAGRDLPDIAAVRVTPDTVELLLSGDDTAVIAPFAATGPRTWAATSQALTSQADTDPDHAYTWPYPALVSIGADDDGAVVLVNLEAAGTLAITGEPATSTAVLRALACELATGPVGDMTVVVASPALGDLATASGHLATGPSTTPGRLARDAKSTVAHTRAWCADVGVRDARHARSRRDLDEPCFPVVHLGADPAPALPAWSGAVIVATADQAPDGAWNLTVQPDGTARLHPPGLDLHASRLTDEAYAHIIELLATAGSDTADRPPTVSSLAEDTVETLAALPDPTTPPQTPSAEPPTRAGADATPTPPDRPDVEDGAAPRVQVLGPVQITGPTGTSGDTRSRRTSELLAYLALHPGATAAELDEVIGGGDRVPAATRNTAISRARAWLGKDPDGQPYLLPYQAGDGYRLCPQVRTDWDDFLHHARGGLAAGPAGTADLTAALALVRGRPFAGTAPGTYDWAEATTQEMISTITDVAHVLARTHLDTGDPAAAAAAAAAGLTVDPCNETLYRDAITAAGQRGDTEEIHRLANNLHAHLDQIDPLEEVDDETIHLIRNLVGTGNSVIGS